MPYREGCTFRMLSNVWIAWPQTTIADPFRRPSALESVFNPIMPIGPTGNSLVCTHMLPFLGKRALARARHYAWDTHSCLGWVYVFNACLCTNATGAPERTCIFAHWRLCNASKSLQRCTFACRGEILQNIIIRGRSPACTAYFI